MEQNFKNIRLGVFVIIGTLFLVMALYFIGNNQNLFGSNFTVHAVFKNVSGLQKGNNVRFSGINVGTVRDIEMINDTSILVSFILKEEMNQFIRRDAIASLGTDGLLGNRIINIIPGDGGDRLINGGDTLKVYHGIDEDEMFSLLERTNYNVAVITNSLVDILKDVQEGKGTVGRLISDSTLANDINETVSNLNTSSKRAVEILDELDKNIANVSEGKGTVGMLLNDTTLANNINRIFEEIHASTSNVEEISRDIRELVTQVQSGPGLTGSIITDSTMVYSLEESLENIRQGTESFNENMEAMKHHFLFRGYFKKLEKEEKKN
ncbi:MlaD family protein [Reichenbachiella sp. MALMAid0571]|uniref:MlaD family protein n=1 Tax=Reichenbachiella sp. MALMAid0571 TaxID=3143939 RepID=UPI0032E0347E